MLLYKKQLVNCLTNFIKRIDVSTIIIFNEEKCYGQTT